MLKEKKSTLSGPAARSGNCASVVVVLVEVEEGEEEEQEVGQEEDWKVKGEENQEAELLGTEGDGRENKIG